MRVFYVDEFGTGGMSPQSITAHPWSVLCALSMAETNRISLASHLETVKDRFLPGWRNHDWKNSEIKGRYLRRAERRLLAGRRPLEPPAYRVLTQQTLQGLVQAIGLTFHKFRPIIYVVAVDKAQCLRRWGNRAHNPVAAAYVYLQQRASLLIEDVYGSDEGALFVADEQYGHERLFTNGTVARVRGELGVALARQPNFHVIFDKPLWVNKGELPADREIIQLADVATFLLATAIRTNVWTDAWLTGWTLPYVARHWTSGRPWDAGITIIPRPQTYPAIP